MALAGTTKLGVLQLKTTFPRPPGDVGNTASWGDIPVVIRVVEEASSDLVVGGGWGQELVDAFVREGEKMMAEDGCVAFVTSCGFLATMHPLLASRLPFMGTSSLLQVAWLQQSFFPGPDSSESVGVVTFKKSALTKRHLTSVGAHPDTPVYGLPEGDEAIFKGVLDERIPCRHSLHLSLGPAMMLIRTDDYDGMALEVVNAARDLVSHHPKVQAVVLECTNMPPFRRQVEKATGRKVWDILTLGAWLYQGAVGPSWKDVQAASVEP